MIIMPLPAAAALVAGSGGPIPPQRAPLLRSATVAPVGASRVALAVDLIGPTVRVGPGSRFGTYPVTTLAQAGRVAMDRTRRMTVLGELPVVGALVVPWLLPLHLLIVGLTADHIRLTPDASLSYCDGVTPRRHSVSVAVAVAVGAGWWGIAVSAADRLLAHALGGGAAVMVAVVLLPPVVELLGLVEFAVLNPEWLTLRRQRERRADGRTTYVLTSLVTRVDGHDHARRLMDLTYPQWQAADAVVIGYPASRRLVSYYVRMGARRERQCRFSGPPARRRVMFDCRQPLRDRNGDRGTACPPAGTPVAHG